mgnify:CR=1 FL=1|jgi:hypothetical protein
MEHPLIGDLKDVSVEDLSSRISDLHKKLSIAVRSGNAHLCNQLRMAIESYNTKYQEKLRVGQTKDFDDKINIQ